MLVEQLARPVARTSVQHEDVELRCGQVLRFEPRGGGGSSSHGMTTAILHAKHSRRLVTPSTYDVPAKAQWIEKRGHIGER